MLFYIKYGCSINHEVLIVDAENFDQANEYAEGAAQDVYYSYDCNYFDEEDYENYNEDELSELEYQDMISDIDWSVESYDESNEEHRSILEEQGGEPYKV